MWDKIIDPINNRKISIFTKTGKNILKNYITNYNLYGGMDSSSDEFDTEDYYREQVLKVIHTVQTVKRENKKLKKKTLRDKINEEVKGLHISEYLGGNTLKVQVVDDYLEYTNLAKPNTKENKQRRAKIKGKYWGTWPVGYKEKRSKYATSQKSSWQKITKMLES